MVLVQCVEIRYADRVATVAAAASQQAVLLAVPQIDYILKILAKVRVICVYGNMGNKKFNMSTLKAFYLCMYQNSFFGANVTFVEGILTLHLRHCSSKSA